MTVHLLSMRTQRNTPASVLDFSLCNFRNCCRKLPSFTNLFDNDEDDDEDEGDAACDGGELRETHRSTHRWVYVCCSSHHTWWRVKSPDGFVRTRAWLQLPLFSQLGLDLSFLLGDQFLLFQDHVQFTVLMRLPPAATWHNENIVNNSTQLKHTHIPLHTDSSSKCVQKRLWVQLFGFCVL